MAKNHRTHRVQPIGATELRETVKSAHCSAAYAAAPSIGLDVQLMYDRGMLRRLMTETRLFSSPPNFSGASLIVRPLFLSFTP